VFGKFVLHVPLYRQQDALAQLGWSPSRSTLGQIVATAGDLVVPLAVQLQLRVLASPVIASDDTPVTLLTPGIEPGSRQARFWIYRGIHETPYNVFAFTDSRAREGPDRFLESFRGTLLGDCYSGYVNIEKVTGGHRAEELAVHRQPGRRRADGGDPERAQQRSPARSGRVGVSVRCVGATGARNRGPELAAAGRLEGRPS